MCIPLDQESSHSAVAGQGILTSACSARELSACTSCRSCCACSGASESCVWHSSKSREAPSRLALQKLHIACQLAMSVSCGLLYLHPGTTFSPCELYP